MEEQMINALTEKYTQQATAQFQKRIEADVLDQMLKMASTVKPLEFGTMRGSNHSEPRGLE